LTKNKTFQPIKLRRSSDREATSHITIEKEGKTLVAVGHCFGVGLVEYMVQGQLKRIRKRISHQGILTSLAISEDRQRLLTVSSDGTIGASRWIHGNFTLNLARSLPSMEKRWSLRLSMMVVRYGKLAYPLVIEFNRYSFNAKICHLAK